MLEIGSPGRNEEDQIKKDVGLVKPWGIRFTITPLSETRRSTLEQRKRSPDESVESRDLRI